MRPISPPKNNPPKSNAPINSLLKQNVLNRPYKELSSSSKGLVHPIDLQRVKAYVEPDVDLLYRPEKKCRQTFDLNIPGGSHQWTALHLAGHASHASVVMQLVAAGTFDMTLNY